MGRLLAPMLLAVLASALSAAPVLSIVGLPGQYTPGEDITFDVTLSGAVDLAAYNIDIILQAPEAAAGTDAWFELPPPPVARYVFGDSPADQQWFLAATATVGTDHFLNLGDFHDADSDAALEPVTTLAPVNDMVATVTLQTTLGMTGDLLIGIDAFSLELDTHLTDGGNPVALDGFSSLRDDLAAAGPVSVSQVPEPATVTIFMVAAGLMGVRRRRS